MNLRVGQFKPRASRTVKKKRRHPNSAGRWLISPPSATIADSTLLFDFRG
jgi:hypothetical protein